MSILQTTPELMHYLSPNRPIQRCIIQFSMGSSCAACNFLHPSHTLFSPPLSTFCSSEYYIFYYAAFDSDLIPKYDSLYGISKHRQHLLQVRRTLHSGLPCTWNAQISSLYHISKAFNLCWCSVSNSWLLTFLFFVLRETLRFVLS